MKVVAYNIQGGARGIDWVAGTIRDLAPDIACLNEVHAAQLGRIERLTGRRAIFGAARRMGLFGRFGNAILARERPRLLANVRLSVSPGIEPRALLVARAGSAVVATTHLGLVETERLTHASAVIDALSGYDTIVLGADLNDVPGSAVLDLMTARFRDSFTPTEHDAGATFPASNPERRIDYVLTAGYTVTSCIVADAQSSDHRPVVAEIECA